MLLDKSPKPLFAPGGKSSFSRIVVALSFLSRILKFSLSVKLIAIKTISHVTLTAIYFVSIFFPPTKIIEIDDIKQDFFFENYIPGTGFLNCFSWQIFIYWNYSFLKTLSVSFYTLFKMSLIELRPEIERFYVTIVRLTYSISRSLFYQQHSILTAYEVAN